MRFLVYILAVGLCLLYTSDALLVAYTYRWTHGANPPGSKLVFYAEAVKLLLATLFFLSEPGNAETLSKRLGLQRGEEEQTLLPKSSGKQALPEAVKPVPAVDALLQWPHGMVMFAVPAVCYFITNNLTIYALSVMPTYTYTMLSDLKIITTGIGGYLLLGQPLTARAAASLVLLFLGICLGQLGTISGDHSTAAAGSTAAASVPWVHAVLVMCLVAVLSAVASVYTEWVFNHAQHYKHESINLQNMRLYASGTVLNAIYCRMTAGPGVLSGMGDMRPGHYVIVLGLACMGLVTAVIIKRFGNIVKIYSSVVASLFAAGTSSFILNDPPAPIFYCGCALAMTAVLQLQRARAAQQLQAAAAAANPKTAAAADPAHAKLGT